MEKDTALRLNIANNTRQEADNKVKAAYEIMNNFDPNSTVHKCIHQMAYANLQMQAATVLAIQDTREAIEALISEVRMLREDLHKKS